MTADENQIRQLVADWMAATQRGDHAAVLQMMTDDVVFLTPGNEPMGKTDFEKATRAMAATGGPVIDGSSDIQEVVIAGDWAFLWSHLTVRVTLPNALSPTERTGHTLTVFRKQSGKWLLARDANLLVAPKQPAA